MTPHSDEKLFNGLPDQREPDWSEFEELTLGGCRVLEKLPDMGEMIEPGVPASEAEFFTVYARLIDGEVAAITDITDPREALGIAAELGVRSGLPVVLDPTLMGGEPNPARATVTKAEGDA